jgi:Zn-dependent protease/CBS domain-containing protein
MFFGARWRLFRLFGIPVYLDVSWLIILVLLSWTLARYFFEELPGLQPGSYGAMGVIAAITFFICIVLHEAGHALVARSSEMPVRGITLFLFGGVAELGGEPRSARSEFAMAIAGPVVSLVLAGILAALAYFGRAAGWAAAVVAVLAYLAWINVAVLLFNMVPAFPLDGGRVLRSILWAVTGNVRRATQWAALCGQAFAWFLIGVGVWLVLMGQFVSGIWLGLIGLFLNNAARSSYQQVVIREALAGEPVRHFMNPNPVVVPPSLDVKHWVEDYVYRFHRRSFPVASNHHLEGFVTTRELARLPREEWDRHTVGELMRHDLGAVSIGPDADALEALQKLQRSGGNRLLVTDGDELLGIVTLRDLLRFLHLKIGLEGPEE